MKGVTVGSIPGAAVCGLLAALLHLPGAPQPALWAERLDGIAAVVDDAIITLSDVAMAEALGLPPISEGSLDTLQAMIDERLMYSDVSRIPLVRVSESEIDKALREVTDQHPSADHFRRLLESLELDEAELREMLERRILVRKYINYRFRPFIMVEPIEVEEALSKARRQRRAIELDTAQARETVRQMLADEKLAVAVRAWVERLREKAHIRILLEPGG